MNILSIDAHLLMDQIGCGNGAVNDTGVPLFGNTTVVIGMKMRQEIVFCEAGVGVVKAVNAVICSGNLFVTGTGTVVSLLGSSRTPPSTAKAVVGLLLLLLFEYLLRLGGAPCSGEEQLVEGRHRLVVVLASTTTASRSSCLGSSRGCGRGMDAFSGCQILNGIAVPSILSAQIRILTYWTSGWSIHAIERMFGKVFVIIVVTNISRRHSVLFGTALNVIESTFAIRRQQDTANKTRVVVAAVVAVVRWTVGGSKNARVSAVQLVLLTLKVGRMERHDGSTNVIH
jgi:hypothetical protein